MRAFFRGVLNALILIIVGLASFLLSMRLAIHGREVSVPKFVNMSVPEAERLAQRVGVQISEDDKFYSAQVAAGKILSQSPVPGTSVRRGFRVQIAVSLGPQMHAIPDVVGQSQRAAELNTRRRGLELGTVALLAVNESAPETVLGQSPAANAEGVATPRMNLLVSQAPEATSFIMPELVGSKLSDATAACDAVGLKIAGVNGISAASGDAVVMAQSPTAGERVTTATPVKLTVAKNAPAIVVQTPIPAAR
ncbi:MAG TPA: PASTA domain-containing protein [Candidatus Acidoferrales bacterium]|nr:PASTA domain-containing protein [Candidatus Acidoferrales bacterium]